ncbi:type III-B CRISPR module RAMP protein Cmr6 [Candidatus Parcubacteria bacterium]|nr:MAG: type III-B CRISPR module RAMP protein Cmr6 [Candidatus Parcubacteria bacterium]
MALPLHREARETCPNQRPEGGHTGLWFDRFFSAYLDATEATDGEQRVLSPFRCPERPEDKKAWADAKNAWIRGFDGSQVGDAMLIARHLERRDALIRALEGCTASFQTDWHFVTGLGIEHPVENGMAWHPTLGVPYLTGAAVKGMLRAWCEIWEMLDGETIRRWFGPSTDELKQGSSAEAGAFVFFDALPTAPVRLKADVMTPHYGEWYAEGDRIQEPAAEPERVPADWHNPNPIPFLVVDRIQTFCFAVAPRFPREGRSELDRVFELLGKALSTMGAGAKTAVGYGRFEEAASSRLKREEEAARRRELQQREDEARKREEEARKREAQLAAMTVHERLLYEAKSRISSMEVRLQLDKSAYSELRGLVNDLIERAAELEPEGRQAVADWLESLYEAHPSFFPDFSAKKRKKKDSKLRERIARLRKEE